MGLTRRSISKRLFLLNLLMVCLVTGCGKSQPSRPDSNTQLWPAAPISPIEKNTKIERRITSILKQMSLEQKVGQMIQAQIAAVTVEDIQTYGIGSVLNGGGQTPNNSKNASPGDWVALAESFYQASMSPQKGPAIPIIWGVDAVHGHGNLHGATLFPHNVGLGATRNEELVEAIGAATAKEVAASGLDWNFSPTVAVARDLRWGRAYESYSEDTALVSQLSSALLRGQQGRAASNGFLDNYHILATAKHYLGDGGTEFGDDRGNTLGDEKELMEIHLPPYLTAIENGLQSVMASYSWWDGLQAHANERLLTGLLKQHLGFDGFIVSDWQAIGLIPGCTTDNCPQAVNAGIDLFMIPNAPDWQNFHRNTVQQVRDGEIPLSRINDAVTRILRVKMRMGLWEKPSPAQRPLAQKPSVVGSSEHRELARQAARESLVLLKNNGMLPLNPGQRILVAGNGANSLSKQTGGWSVSWTGAFTTNEDFPGSTSIYEGIKAAVEAAGGSAYYDEHGEINAPVDAAIVVMGELPYAEWFGDIQNLQTLEFEQNTKTGLKLIKKLKSQGIPVAAVFLSGRPLWVNKELNAADAFVAAWWPGTEGAAIADVILSAADGSVNYDFSGKLSFSWPRSPCQAQVNIGDNNYKPLYPFGYGLTYAAIDRNWSNLSEDSSDWLYGCRLGKRKPAAGERTLNNSNGWQFYAEKTSMERSAIQHQIDFAGISASPIVGGVYAAWDGSMTSRISLRNGRIDNSFLPQLAHQGTLSFDIKRDSDISGGVGLVMLTGPSARRDFSLNEALQNVPKGQWQTLHLDLSCAAGLYMDIGKLSVPFSIETGSPLTLSIRNVRVEPNSAKTSIPCPESNY